MNFLSIDSYINRLTPSMQICPTTSIKPNARDWRAAEKPFLQSAQKDLSYEAREKSTSGGVWGVEC
jgi:hypothetical protein